MPDKVGSGFTMPPIFEPLAPYRKQTVILSGLHARSAEAPEGQSPPDHWVASAFLCANKPKRTAGADIYNGTTIDQLIAQKIGQETLLPSMQFAVEDPGANSSNCGEGYSCAYTNSISWSTPTTPLPMELNPQLVFERMFGDGGTPEERAARRQDDRSILDSLMASLSRLKVGLDPADRLRLDEYAQDVREIERRLQIAVKATAAAPTNTAVPVGVPESFDEHIKLQFDLLALALRADITRVATMLFARDLTVRSYPESGVTVAFHAGSHHGEDEKRKAEYARLNRYHVAMLAYFVERAGEDAGRRRDAARSFAGALWLEHGELESAPPRGCPARPRRGRQRKAEGRPSPGLSDDDDSDGQSAAEPSGSLRHSPGQHRRQHRTAGGPVVPELT